MTARVTPGATALDIQSKHAAAQQALADELVAGDVTDLTAARCADQRRRELQSSRDQLTATLVGLCGDDQLEQLHSRLAQLRAPHPAELDPFGTDTATARAELEVAEAARIVVET